MGKSSGAVNKGGRPAKASQPGLQTGMGAPPQMRPRGRPRRPPPVPEVAEDSGEQADVRAVRARLLKMGASCPRDSRPCSRAAVFASVAGTPPFPFPD